MFVQPVVEDIIQELILIKLFEKYRPEVNLHGAIGKKGNSYIKKQLHGFNNASKHVPHIIITDLDDLPCSPSLIQNWIDFKPTKDFLFRIAVREAEAWLFADRKGFSKFIGAPLNKIPSDSETITHPKEFVIFLAKKSKKKMVKDIIPQGTAKVGPGYNMVMQDFIIRYWNIQEAINHSRSLAKAVKRIEIF
ncbi:MAG: DUF4276 family protein [Bacteroidetes bacterium]|nr:DUF4276 family protein [Bacteroidota bacterium]